MDSVLHAERIDGGQKVTWPHSLAGLPHGSMFQAGNETYAIFDGEVRRWNFEGYSAAIKEDLPETVGVLAPRSVVNIFMSGFMPEFHPSALSLISYSTIHERFELMPLSRGGIDTRDRRIQPEG